MLGFHVKKMRSALSCYNFLSIFSLSVRILGWSEGKDFIFYKGGVVVSNQLFRAWFYNWEMRLVLARPVASIGVVISERLSTILAANNKSRVPLVHAKVVLLQTVL